MTDHPLCRRIDELDEAIGNSADLSPAAAKDARAHLTELGRIVRTAIAVPQPGAVGGYLPVTSRQGERTHL